MTNTPRASLPELAAAQAQKHVTHNDALIELDALICARILDRDLTAPPGSPADGDAYIVKATGTGAWAGEDGKIAYCVDGAWRFYAPFAGLTAYITDEAEYFIYNGTSWADLSTVLSLQNLPMLGVNTTADSTNKLAVASSAVLLTNIGASVKAFLNKNASADTASFLFETNFSGRAEIGLTGDDNFHFKVSPDGSTWYEGLQIDRNTGSLLLKHVDVTSATTLGATHLGRIVRGDATSGAFAITLPASADTDDWVIVRKKDSGANRVTVKNNSGTDMAWLSAQYDEAMFAFWDGAWTLVRCRIAPLVQVFTASGTYTKPPLAQFAEILCIGSGGGGGAGRRGAAGSVRFGGGGGSSGPMTRERIPASSLGATETVTIGSGGAGAPAVASDNSDGAAGGFGGTSSFGNHFRAVGGNPGSGGSASSGSGGTSLVGSGNIGWVGTGGASSVSAAAGTGSGGTSACGGAGGGISSGDAAQAGGAGGNGTVWHGSGSIVGASGGTSGSAGGAGTDISNTYDYWGGSGGGGGAASTSAAAGAGGNGGNPGGGGGGGGASVNGNNSGAGGAGGRGEVRVTTYF